MRKSLTFLIVLLVLIMHICFVPAISESLPAYSVDAADYFCRVWNYKRKIPEGIVRGKR